MYKSLCDIPKELQEKVRKYYHNPNHSIKNMKKKYNLHRNEILAMFGHRHFLHVRNNHIYLPPLCTNTANNIIGCPYPGFVIAKKENDELNFYYYVFEEKLHTKRREVEIKAMQETRLDPQCFGKVLSLKKEDYE